jgi:hypothetical protein
MTCNKISPCRGGLYFSDTFCVDIFFFKPPLAHADAQHDLCGGCCSELPVSTCVVKLYLLLYFRLTYYWL